MTDKETENRIKERSQEVCRESQVAGQPGNLTCNVKHSGKLSTVMLNAYLGSDSNNVPEVKGFQNH